MERDKAVAILRCYKNNWTDDIQEALETLVDELKFPHHRSKDEIMYSWIINHFEGYKNQTKNEKYLAEVDKAIKFLEEKRDDVVLNTYDVEVCGRRGRQGNVPGDISKKAEEYQKDLKRPYDGNDIISAYETGAMEERKNIFDAVSKVADVKNVVDGIALNMSLGGGDTTRVVSTEDLHIENGTKVKMIIL